MRARQRCQHSVEQCDSFKCPELNQKARARHNEPALIRAQHSWPRQPRPRRQTSGARQLALANLVSPWQALWNFSSGRVLSVILAATRLKLGRGTSTAPWPDGACVCMVARWLAVRRGQGETVWRGAAAVVPRLCGRWLLRLHWRDNHDGRCGHGGDQADAQHFRSMFARFEAPKMECRLGENGEYQVTNFIARLNVSSLAAVRKT